MKREKMTLGITLYSDGNDNVNLNKYAFTFRKVTTDTDGKFTRETVSNVMRDNHSVTSLDTMTDFFYAVVNELAPKFTYTAIKTAYARSGHPMLYGLLTELAIRTPDFRNDSFADYLSIDNHIDEFVCKSRNLVKEREYAQGQKMQFVVTHKKKLVKFPDGSKHFVQILPTYEAKNTTFGQETYNGIDSNVSFDCEDLIQTARLAILELAKMGFLKSVRDIYEYRKYVYARVNHALHGERKHNIHDVPLYITVGDGKEVPSYSEKTVKQVDKMLTHVERKAVIEYLLSILDEADGRNNVDGMKYAFKRVFVDGVTREQVAREKGVSKMTVTRWINGVKKYLTNEENRIEVFETLTSFIVG